MRNLFAFVFALCLALTSAVAFGQDIQTKGSIAGTVTDKNGAAVPGATVKITGSEAARTVTTDNEGVYRFDNLVPGNYTVRVEMTGFKASEVSKVTVYVGKAATTNVTLEAGNISETVTVTGGAAIDQASTAVSSNLNDQLFANVPVQRGVASLFYLAPGVTDSVAGGTANPSISGGSALDNLYVADGVNITDSAFGGLGVFSRNYGTVGTGINTSFIKEVQVKTGGFEPQFGQSQGGIINIITKSGGNEYHGAIYGYARPKSFEATRLQPDAFRTNKRGELLHEENYDAGTDVGGYIPGLRNKLFFFGSFNPSVRREIVRGAQGSGISQLLGDYSRRYRTLNYAFKLDYNVNPSHQITFSIFGDPTRTNVAPFAFLNIDNLTAVNSLDYGTRNMAVRYNGSLSPTWTVSGSFSQGRNHFDETGFPNLNLINDFTQLDTRGNFIAQGYGFFEPTQGKTYRATFDTTKTVTINRFHLGTHTFGLGYQFQRGQYSGRRDESGPRYTVPATNADGTPLTNFSSRASAAIGQSLNAGFQLFTADSTCTLCPFLNIPGIGDTRVLLFQDRGEFGDPVFNTFSNYHAAYIQDTWRVNRHVTALLGLRTEQERIIGNPLPVTGKRLAYSFTGQWAPRLGVSVDPLGHGKTKVYYNFGRFFEYIPLDLAERSLSRELDFLNASWAPDFFIDAGGNRRARISGTGTVIPVLDAAHLLDGATGGVPFGIGISSQNKVNPILPGTKLGFAQEHVIGFEQQLPRNFILSVRYLDRRLKRIVEDAAVVSPEGYAFFGQTYFIGNINSRLDAAVNPISHVFPVGGPIPAACDPNLVNPAVTNSAGQVVGAVCWETNGRNGQPAGDPGADGVPDGFPDPVHNYKALEIELNKRFSNNWQLLSNWRISRLIGNFEGHFRNDNGQTDPAISSLFDFTGGDFGLLGDQFKAGPLNTDRRHVLNVYGSYAFSNEGFGRRLNRLNLGAGLHMESGVPISEFLAHPAYNNAGEIPSGGRGKLGRTPFYAQLDLHADYRYPLGERVRLLFVGDFFNVTNNRRLRLPDQNRQLSVGQNNVDFLQPNNFHLPFSMRLGVRLEW
jgi:hypothetical protein